VGAIGQHVWAMAVGGSGASWRLGLAPNCWVQCCGVHHVATGAGAGISGEVRWHGAGLYGGWLCLLAGGGCCKVDGAGRSEVLWSAVWGVGAMWGWGWAVSGEAVPWLVVVGH